MSAHPERVFLHVGTRKSGTTWLQQALSRSERALAAEGVHLLYPDRNEARRALMNPLRVLRDDFDEEPAKRAVRQLRALVEERPAPVHLLSVETLAEMPHSVTKLVVGALEERYEVHVVVTARHWGLTLPSEWQQGIKSRWTISYVDFLAAVRDRRSEAAAFIARQHLPNIVDRWGALLPPSRVHVIACPPRSRTEGTLLELFCEVVGFDPAVLKLGARDHNATLSLAQAELVRRVNDALGERLPLQKDRYQEGIRRRVVRRSLRRLEGASIRLPEEFALWAAAESADQLEELRAQRVDLVGDPRDLVADPAAPGGPSMPSEADVIDVAVETIADLATRQLDEVERLERTIAKLKKKHKRARAKSRRP